MVKDIGHSIANCDKINANELFAHYFYTFMGIFIVCISL